MDHDEDGPRTIYVSFGPKDHQVMPLAWAETFLHILKEEHPYVFGEVLAKSIGIEMGNRPRGRAVK